jgi:hypothetical protein
MVATEATLDVQVAREVRSAELPSVNVPTALN